MPQLALSEKHLGYEEVEVLTSFALSVVFIHHLSYKFVLIPNRTFLLRFSGISVEFGGTVVCISATRVKTK